MTNNMNVGLTGTPPPSLPKYSEGDIFTHRTFPNERRKILCVFYHSNEVMYMIRNINNDNYPPLHIEEPALDKYYIFSCNTPLDNSTASALQT